VGVWTSGGWATGGACYHLHAWLRNRVAVGFLSFEFGLRGVLLAILGVFPQNLIAVPAMLVAAVATTSFSVYVLRRKPARQTSFGSELASYTVIILAMIVLVIAASTFEAYVAPVLMRLFAGFGTRLGASVFRQGVIPCNSPSPHPGRIAQACYRK
jgi:uncharacterized membrane protein SpoIIM required for sporulation